MNRGKMELFVVCVRILGFRGKCAKWQVDAAGLGCLFAFGVEVHCKKIYNPRNWAKFLQITARPMGLLCVEGCSTPARLGMVIKECHTDQRSRAFWFLVSCYSLWSLVKWDVSLASKVRRDGNNSGAQRVKANTVESFWISQNCLFSLKIESIPNLSGYPAAMYTVVFLCLRLQTMSLIFWYRAHIEI